MDVLSIFKVNNEISIIWCDFLLAFCDNGGLIAYTIYEI